MSLVQSWRAMMVFWIASQVLPNPPAQAGQWLKSKRQSSPQATYAPVAEPLGQVRPFRSVPSQSSFAFRTPSPHSPFSGSVVEVVGSSVVDVVTVVTVTEVGVVSVVVVSGGNSPCLHSMVHEAPSG